MHRPSIWRAAILSLLGFLLAANCSSAQDFRAVLTGQVTDPSGAVIRNATITAVNAQSGTSYTGKTSDKGVYYIPYVLPGTYAVTAKSDGFKTQVQDKVLLLASESFNQNFSLQVGSASERVVVTTAPAQLETSTASNNTVLSQRELQNVPLNGGQSYTLIGTTPGSQFTQTQFGTGGYHGTTGWDVSNSYSIGGGIVGNNQFTLNGTNITSQYGYDNHSPGEWTVSPNLDAVEEVNVMTTTYDARYGRTSGGTVNVVTRSGGDQYHGSARYAYEGAFMNANTFQNNLTGTPRQGEVQNQFWITAGGPIIRKKLFAFFGFEGYRQSLAGTTLENVPPAYLRPGYNGNAGVNFGLIQQMDAQEFPTGVAIFQPGTATCLDGGTPQTCNSNHVVQTQFANNTIPAGQISSSATALLKYIPLPNLPGAQNLARGSNYVGITPDLYDYNQPMVRVDYNLTDKTKLYSYFLYWKGTENRTQNGLTGVPANGNIDYTHQNWVATQDVTHTFSSTMVGDFKISFDRFAESSPDGDLSQQTDPTTALGLAMPLPSYTNSKYLPEIHVNDSWGTGLIADNPAGDHTIFGNQLNADVTNNYTLDADLTKTWGAHTFEFGGEIDEFQYGGRPYSGGHPNGVFGFGSGFTQYNPHNQNCYPASASVGNANNCTSNTPNGSALASLYLGDPSSTADNTGPGGIDWIPPIMEGYPVYAVYFQDNWRVNHRLTLNLGIRYDVQRGLRERFNHLNRGLCLTCVNPLTNDPTYQANIAEAGNMAAWTAAGIDPSSLKTVYGGLEFTGFEGQSRDAYNTNWNDVGPRIGIAFAIDPKTVVRLGYGVMYSYGLEGGSSIGEAQTTNYTASLDNNNTPTTNFQSGNPFATGLLKPTGDSEGLLTDVGNGTIQADFPDRKIPMEQITSFGFQRALPGGFVLDARYAGNFSSRLRVSLWLNGVATRAEQMLAQANPAVWNQQVPNPYYGVAAMSGPGQCGTSTTVEAIALLYPGSQYCSPGGNGLVGQYNAGLGRNWYDGLEVKLNKTVSGGTARGLSTQLAYTYSKTINGDGYENGWPYQDPFQEHWIAGTDRTHVLSVTGVYDLPIGRDGLLLANTPRAVSAVISHWTLSEVFNAQSGFPVGLNTGWWYECPSQSFRAPGGTSVGAGRWLNASANCWQGIPTYGLMNLPGNTTQVRDPTIPSLDLSLAKNTPLWENTTLQLRLDAFNALNSVLFGGPDNNPGDGPANFSPNGGWSGFGTVGPTQQNFPRILQLSGKVSF
jgi:hypothetical protein